MWWNSSGYPGPWTPILSSCWRFLGNAKGKALRPKAGPKRDLTALETQQGAGRCDGGRPI